MSLNTHVWQNDQWVTRTLGTDKVLEANAPEPMPELFHASRPLCGLLTRTVVESPTVQFILPARLRDGYHNDIAFVSVGTSSPPLSPQSLHTRPISPTPLPHLRVLSLFSRV